LFKGGERKEAGEGVTERTPPKGSRGKTKTSVPAHCRAEKKKVNPEGEKRKSFRSPGGPD